MPPFDMLGSFADPLNQDIGAGKLVNCRIVPRKPQENKPGKVRLVGSPGLTLVSKPSTSPCIAICHALGNIWTGHADGSIYYGVETGIPTRAGTVQVDPSYPVIRMAEDRTALAIASNADSTGKGGAGTGYTATQTAGVVNANFQASDNIQFDPSAVCELDNQTIWAGASNVYANQSSKMYSSVALAPSNVQANSFATKEARADAVLDVVTLGRTFWPMGARSIEQWYDAGSGSDFPFVAFTNSLTEVGLAARLSLANLHGRVMFVGTDRRIWVGAGQVAQAVSPAWVDLLLQQIDLSQLTAYMYAQGGDDFYVLTYNGAWTIELALSSMSWCYRQSNGRSDHVGRCATEHDSGVTYVGLVTGEVCRVDLTSASEPAGTLTRQIISPWIGSQQTRHNIDTVEMSSYLGPAAGSFQLDWSADGLQTWKGERLISFPTVGERRAIARQMGSSRRRQLRLQYTGSAAPFSIDEFFLGISQGT
jgi:hypothetical protein